MRKIILFIGFALISGMVSGQETCKEKLYKANLLYEQGQLDEVIKMAQSCTGSENKGEQFQAWHLLAMTYLAQGQKAEARKCAEKMLEIQPTYRPSKVKDPAELIRLLNSVRVVPKLSFGMAPTLGISKTIPRVQRTYNGGNYTKSYESNRGFQSGLIFGYHMNELISLHSGLLYTRKSYRLTYAFEGYDFTMDERLNHINLPAFARFTVAIRGRLHGYADVGVYTGRLVSSFADFSREDIESGETFSVENLNATSRRNNWEYGSIFGAGLMMRYKQVEFTLEAKYFRAAFYNATNTDRRYEPSELFYQYYYLDDDFRLDNFVLAVSVAYNINYRILRD